MTFCTNCGKQLIEGAAFCSNCGTRAPQQAAPPMPAYPMPPSLMPPPPAAPQPPKMDFGPIPTASGAEDVVLLMKVNHKLGTMNAVVCHLVFKRHWLVLAHLTQRLVSAETAKLQETLKAQNLGVMKRSSAQMRFWADFQNRYYTMSTEAILAEDPSNKAIRYDAVSWSEFKCAHESTDQDGYSDGMNNSHFTIVTAGGETLKFTHQNPGSRSLKDALTPLFGPRLTYKR
jgi:hypothetical protein